MTYIIGSVTDLPKEVELYGADGRVLQLVGEAVPLVVSDKEEAVSDEEVLAELKSARAELAALQSAKATKVAPSTEAKAINTGGSSVKKNHKEVKANPARKYVRLGTLKTLKMFGKIPQQQADLAAILAESMDVGAEWTEAEVFELLKDSVKDYESLRRSVMHVTYLFAYYRGLKNDGIHAGFIARDFLRQIN